MRRCFEDGREDGPALRLRLVYPCEDGLSRARVSLRLFRNHPDEWLLQIPMFLLPRRHDLSTTEIRTRISREPDGEAPSDRFATVADQVPGKKGCRSCGVRRARKGGLGNRLGCTNCGRKPGRVRIGGTAQDQRRATPIPRHR